MPKIHTKQHVPQIPTLASSPHQSVYPTQTAKNKPNTIATIINAQKMLLLVIVHKLEWNANLTQKARCALMTNAKSKRALQMRTVLPMTMRFFAMKEFVLLFLWLKSAQCPLIAKATRKKRSVLMAIVK